MTLCDESYERFVAVRLRVRYNSFYPSRRVGHMDSEHFVCRTTMG